MSNYETTILTSDRDVNTAMLGAVCGDVAGSVYEHHNIKYKLGEDQLISSRSRFTDDTVMTCAVADGLRKGLESLGQSRLDAPDAEDILSQSVCQSLHEYGNKFPYAGYGGSFRRWLSSTDPQPYNSWGNGSAMRASYAGWIASSLQEAEKLADISACVTHNHPEGVKGAKVVAGCIYLLLEGGTKEDVRKYTEQYYDIGFTLDSIRESYVFDVSCQGSVPQAVVAFLEGESFADVISNAISIGGDSDTIAAIAGSIAEVIYPIPRKLRTDVISRLDKSLLQIIIDSVDYMRGVFPGRLM